jgi:hypothetical protein
MASAVLSLAPVQRPYLFAALALIAGLFIHLAQGGPKLPALFAVGLGLGVALYHAAFGFTAAYRRAFLERDISGITAQLLMLAAAMVLFAPVLAGGQVFGQNVSGAIAPVSVSMAFGAFIFGIGMQLGGGCGSGTLFTVGGGNLRMVLTLVFFCLGGLLGSLDMEWWSQLPGIGSVALGRELGWTTAIALQLAALCLIYLVLRRLGGENKRSLWWEGGFSRQRLLQGPWPFLLSAGLLALFNWATLLIAGHPWSITWAFTLWAAKAAMALGWDISSNWFWSGGFTGRALLRPILADTTSVMNIGIVFGAFTAASLAGKVAPKTTIPPASLLAAVIGGLLLGYGARLAYGCNIGAFFSGIASTSLHGWVWIVFAIAGNFIGVRLRPLFRL